MSFLQCSASSCANNNNGMCCRPNIKVRGANTYNPSGTKCGSYIEISGGYSNSTKYDVPNQSLDIKCEAGNCAYNHSGDCTADIIRIDYDSINTACSTFKNK